MLTVCGGRISATFYVISTRSRSEKIQNPLNGAPSLFFDGDQEENI